MLRLSLRRRLSPSARQRHTPVFDSSEFTPVGLVQGILDKYVLMPERAGLIYALWVCFSHVYMQFGIAPRIALTSEEPDSGKSVSLGIARYLVHRPNSRRRLAPVQPSLASSTRVLAPYCSTRLIMLMQTLGEDYSGFGISGISAGRKFRCRLKDGESSSTFMPPH